MNTEQKDVIGRKAEEMVEGLDRVRFSLRGLGFHFTIQS